MEPHTLPKASKFRYSVEQSPPSVDEDEDEDRLHGIHSLKFSLVAEDDPKLQRERTASFIAGEGHD